jgi:YbbR domain-containing protein
VALFPRIVSRNWLLKLAALGLAVVLWALVRSEPTSQGNLFTVPVQAQVGDLNWTLSGEPDPPTVQVRFRGPTGDLIRLAREGATLRLPLDIVSSADTVVQLRRDWVVVSAGSGLVVEDIAPASVRLLLQRTVSRLLPLRVTTTGELSSGLALAAPLGLNPQVVGVRGAAQRVRGLDSITLQPLDLGGVRESGIFPVNMDTTGLDDIIVTPRSATIGVRVEPSIERELMAVLVVPESGEDRSLLYDSLTILPAAISVRLQGARTPVSGVRPEEVQAVVPWEALVGLEPEQERRVPIRLRGLPVLVLGIAAVDSVTVHRSASDARAGGTPTR